LFRSVGARLTLALALVVAVALGVGYAVVVPLLEDNLTQAKLDQLTRSAEAEARRFPRVRGLVDLYIADAAAATNSRVVLITPLGGDRFVVQEDSGGMGRAPDLSDDEVALRATLTFAPARDVVSHDGRKFAEVAFPVITGSFEPTVVLFVAPLDDTLATVKLVERRLLAAGGVALLVAALLGVGGSSVFARRLRRLERAADRIAQGKLDEPVIDHGSDEVAQLAHAFERMRQRLAQLEHARREFIANASHELRTPIFSLGGFLELLDDEDLDEETRREFMATMQGQIERLTRLASDLLDLSRLDAGRLRIELEHVHLGVLAAALADEFAAVALATEHPIAVEAASRAPMALADEQRVLQIGRILVDNALKHTPPQTRIAIRVGQEAGRAVFAVEDEGPGIPPEHAGHVFERFYRVEGPHASGSGLGLAVGRELAEAMDGTLELESRPGRTVFSLRLPVTAAVTESEPAQSVVS
jgi:signal transduction histidine kinase